MSIGKYKNIILNLSLKKIYSHFFLNDTKKSSYYNYIKDLVYEFLLNKYPNYNKVEFEKKLNSLVDKSDDYKDLMSELTNLFNPNFDDNIQNHYKFYEKHIFFKFIIYSINTKLINNKYSKIYDFAINEIKEPLKILEIGGGMPHGLIFNVWKKGKLFCNKLNYVDADLLHSEFVDWYCKKNEIPLEIKLFPAAKTPEIEGIKYNFVFAKDIFEHLDAPEKLIDDLIANTTNSKTLLCLDLEHKGEKTVQHLNPNLPVLKKKLIDNKFKIVKKFDEILIWKKENL